MGGGGALAVGAFGTGALAALLLQVRDAGGWSGIRAHRVPLAVFAAPYLLWGLAPGLSGLLIQAGLFLIPLYFVVVYKGAMAPPLGEGPLLSLDILFWYAFLTRYGLDDGIGRAAAVILGIPSVYIVALVLSGVRIGVLGKLAAFSCHFLYSALLGYWQLQSGLRPALREAWSGGFLGSLNVLAGGFAATLLFINLGYLSLILFSEKKKEGKPGSAIWPALKAGLAARYQGGRFPPGAGLGLLVVQAGLLYANHRWNWVSEALAVNFTLLLGRWIPQLPQARNEPPARREVPKRGR